MPLSAAPNRGFSEFQRTGPYDGPLYTTPGVGQPLPETTPVLDVSRFAYIGGYDNPSSVGHLITQFRWFTAADGAVLLGSRSIVLASEVNDNAQYRLPNLGPFVQVNWVFLSGANTAHFAVLESTNRVHPCELIPQAPVVIDQQAAAIGASATVTVYPSDYYAGPMMVWTNGGPGVIVFFDYLTTGNVWDTVAEYAVAALANDVRTLVAPPGAWRLRVKNNTAGASAYSLTVTPSLTGAA